MRLLETDHHAVGQRRKMKKVIMCVCVCIVIVCTLFITLYNVWPEEGCCSFTIFAARLSVDALYIHCIKVSVKNITCENHVVSNTMHGTRCNSFF